MGERGLKTTPRDPPSLSETGMLRGGGGGGKKGRNLGSFHTELELELRATLIQPQMAQKPVLRGELRARKWARVRGAYVVRREGRCGRARVVQGAWFCRRVL